MTIYGRVPDERLTGSSQRQSCHFLQRLPTPRSKGSMQSIAVFQSSAGLPASLGRADSTSSHDTYPLGVTTGLAYAASALCAEAVFRLANCAPCRLSLIVFPAPTTPQQRLQGFHKLRVQQVRHSRAECHRTTRRRSTRLVMMQVR